MQDIDGPLPSELFEARPPARNARLKRRLQENAVNPAPGVLCSLCGQVAELSLCGCAVTF